MASNPALGSRDFAEVLKVIVDNILLKLLVDRNYSSLHSAELVHWGWRHATNPICEQDLGEGVLGGNVDCVGTAFLLMRKFEKTVRAAYPTGLVPPLLN
jgi:hypothetical protein